MISVIVPTYNNWEALQECLFSLINQSFKEENYEIIVVNNNPGGFIPDWIKSENRIKLITESKKGSYSARNAGALESIGDILCFTDSDCIPDKEWLFNINEEMSSQSVNIIAGAVEIIPFDSDNISAFEAYDIAVGIRQDLYVKRGSAATANLSLKRDVFNKLGGFDSSRLSGGDTDFCKRAFSAGFTLIYCENAIVRHPARSDWRELVNKSKRIYGSRAKTTGNEYIKRLLTAFMPPLVRSIIIVNSDLSFNNKLKALAVLFAIKFVQSVEFIKVTFGKDAIR